MTLAAGCGSGGSSGGSAAPSSGAGSSGAPRDSGSFLSFTQAKAQWQAAQAPVKWNGPTTPAKAAANKKIVILACPLTLQGCSVATDSVEAAAQDLGWTTKVLEVTDSYAAQFNVGLTQNPDAIISIGFPASSLPSAGLATAKAKHIPIVDINGDCAVGPQGCDATQSFSESDMGRLQGLAVMMATSGHARILSFIDNELSDGYQNNAYTIAWLRAHCGGCTVLATSNFLSANVGTTLGAQTVALVRKYPDANTILTPYDPVAGVQVPALLNAGLGSRIKLVSNIGLKPNLQFVAQNSVQVADVANALDWGSWAAVDKVIRLLSKQPLPPENVPLKIMTQSNAPKSGIWNDDGVNFKAQYLKLWGVRG
jgi:ABC-type sugar transport system substrate-binding protein